MELNAFKKIFFSINFFINITMKGNLIILNVIKSWHFNQSTVCIKKMATRIITAYNSTNFYQIIIILISHETLFFCLSIDVFFVEIEKVEEEEFEKKDTEKLIISLTIN